MYIVPFILTSWKDKTLNEIKLINVCQSWEWGTGLTVKGDTGNIFDDGNVLYLGRYGDFVGIHACYT